MAFRGTSEVTTERSRRPKGVIQSSDIGIRPYLLTIKCNHKQYTSRKDLEDLYNWLVKRMANTEWHSDYALELDKDQRLHIHGAFIKKLGKVNPASYRRKGYTIHFSPFDTFEHAIGYMNKEDQSECAKNQREAQSYYHYNYGFIE